MTTQSELLEAENWGDGFCLACGKREPTVPSPNASECEDCGAVAVIPAQMIISFIGSLETDDTGKDETSLS